MTYLVNAFLQGGIWMWLILILQMISIAIIIERSLFLYKNMDLTECNFSLSFEKLIRQGSLDEVIKKAESSKKDHILSHAILAGSKTASNLGGKEEIQGKMDEILLEQVSEFEKRTSFLPMLANVGTLTGLLGTIMGMIKSFSAVASANPVEKAALLSSGISEAMNTTAYGLVMAIPALIGFAVLSNRANELNEDLSQGALKIYNWLSYNYDHTGVKNK